MMTAYIAAVSSKHRTAEKWWRTSTELCIAAARRALESLAAECNDNKIRFTQGNPLSDGYFYTARITILSGLLSAASLSSRLRKESWKHEDFVRRFLLEYLPKMRLWGESAVPYAVLACLNIEHHGELRVAESLIINIVRSIAEVNATRGTRGLSSPYYEPESALRIALGLEKLNAEVFVGQSYTLEPLIQHLARRWIRKNLALIWEKITRVNFTRFETESDSEYFRWRSDSGKLVTTLPRCPQSWEALLAESEAPPNHIPLAFRKFPEMALYFSLVYPHRFSTELLKIIERGACQRRDVIDAASM